MPYPWERAADDVEDIHTPREEWGVVISNVTPGNLMAMSLFEERVVFIHC